MVSDVLAVKGEQIHHVEPQTSVLDAIQKMNQHKIGALIVMQDGQVAGIFTERDVLRRVIGLNQPLAEVTVAAVMTTDVICVGPETDLDEIATIMKNRKIRHIPVCDRAGRLHGMVSIGDLNAYHTTHQEAHIHFLSEYISGRV
jgi:CBS domain-containing protein